MENFFFSVPMTLRVSPVKLSTDSMKSTSFLFSKCTVPVKTENPLIFPLLMTHRPFLFFFCQNYSTVFAFIFQMNPSCLHSIRFPEHLNASMYIHVSVFKIYATVFRQLTPHATICPKFHLQLEPRTDSYDLLLNR